MNRHIVSSLLATLFAMSVVIVAYAFRNADRITDFFYFDGGTGAASSGSWRPLFYVIAMLFGILCGYLHSHLTSRKRVNVWREIKRAVNAGALTRSLLVSPIVFGAVYALTKEQPDMLIGTLCAFENGFFCDVIFRRREDLILEPSPSGAEEPST